MAPNTFAVASDATEGGNNLGNGTVWGGDARCHHDRGPRASHRQAGRTGEVRRRVWDELVNVALVRAGRTWHYLDYAPDNYAPDNE